MIASRIAPGQLRSVVTYLEMTHGPDLPPARPPRTEGTIVPVAKPSVPFYRYLFAVIGEPWLWMERRKMSDAELTALIQDPGVDIQVLYVDGEPGGYFELDCRDPSDIELVYCGVVPWLIGQGWGRFILLSAIERAWSFHPRRMWLHTCDLDHSGAIAFYQRQGFVVYDEQVEIFDDPRLTGLLPRSAGPHIPIAE